MKPAPAVFDAAAARAEFPALSRKVGGKAMVYLDNACTALKSARMSRTLAEAHELWGSCGGKRSTHLLAQEVEERFQAARSAVAAFLNAERPDDVVFTSGTTEGVNLVARGFAFQGPRREVVVGAWEHNSALLPFVEAERRGECVLRVCPVRAGRLDLDALEGLIGDKTALVALARSSNVLGGALPAAQVSKMCRRRGARLLLDDAQFLSSHREDVRASGADFVVFSAHKLGGPFGLGVLWGEERALNALRPAKVGGGTVKDVVLDGGRPTPVWLDAPMRHEAGVPNIPGALAFAEALALLDSWDPAAVRAHVAGLVRRTVTGIARVAEAALVGDPAALEEGSLAALRSAHPSFSVKDFNLYLNHELPGRFVAARAGEHCAHLLHASLGLKETLRVSFFAYNTAEETDLFCAALEGYAKEACR
ncbi:MAG: aminotransferase class V-fold PLP-dependent enzyme [Elusimicrobia bacterium]|nr:aminotransferase class V-fold PLP-dependent enzyme [Elusimicrobiota bacterium]